MDLDIIYRIDPETLAVKPLQIKPDPDGGFTDLTPAAALGSDDFRPLEEWGGEWYTEDGLQERIDMEVRDAAHLRSSVLDAVAQTRSGSVPPIR